MSSSTIGSNSLTVHYVLPSATTTISVPCLLRAPSFQSFIKSTAISKSVFLNLLLASPLLTLFLSCSHPILPIDPQSKTVPPFTQSLSVAPLEYSRDPVVGATEAHC